MERCAIIVRNGTTVFDLFVPRQSEIVVQEHKAKLSTLTDTKKELEQRVTEADTGGTEDDKKQAQEALQAGRKTNFKEWKVRGKSTLKVPLPFRLLCIRLAARQQRSNLGCWFDF
eukprot:COSAG05_NODE_376_length_10629_cov_43.288319_3_plen_115_part_00